MSFSFLSASNAAFNEETDSTPASPYPGFHQPASAPADASPGWAANSWANEYVFVSILYAYRRVYLLCVLKSILVSKETENS